MRTVKTVKRRGSGLNRLRARLREAAFALLYSRFAWAYDWVSRTFFMNQWRVWQRAALSYIEGERVLEIGMGTGDLQLDLRHAGYETWGIDFSPQMLRQARRKAAALGEAPFRAARGRAQTLPFPSGLFDAVVSTFPSEYIADRQTLAEARRVLAPGGRLVVVPGGWLEPHGTRGRVLDRVSRAVYGDNTGGTGVQNARKGRAHRAAQSAWVRVLAARMTEAGFDVDASLVTNHSGTALVVTGEASPSPAATPMTAARQGSREPRG